MIDRPDHRVNHEEVHTLVIDFSTQSVYTKLVFHTEAHKINDTLNGGRQFPGYLLTKRRGSTQIIPFD